MTKLKKLFGAFVALCTISSAFAADYAAAKIGETQYETLHAAFAAAQSGDTVNILAGEHVISDTDSIVIDKAITIVGAGRDSTKLVFDTAASAFVIKSSNVTFKDMEIVQGVKDNSFHISIDKGAWNAPAIAYSNIAIENITFKGSDYALCLIGENVVVDGCVFTDQDSHNIIVYSLKGESKILNCTFNASKGSNKSAILWEGGYDSATDLSGFVGGGKFVVKGNTAIGKGVFFQFTNWGHVEDMDVEITENVIDAFTNKAIALYTENPSVASGDEFASFTVADNAFLNVPAGRTILKEYTGTVEVEADKNYLGSAEPVLGSLFAGEKVEVAGYYTSYESGELGGYVANVTPVAKIGTTGYATLLQAFAAAKSGDKVELLGDLTLQAGDIDYYQNIKVPAGVTFDGGNYELVVMESQDSDYAVIWSDGAYTVQNLSIKVMGRREANRSVFNFSKGGKLSNVKIWAQVLDIGVNYDKPVDGMEFIVENCEISNVIYAFYCDPNASDIDVTIKDSIINSQRFGSMQHDEKIEGNTLTSTCTKGISLGASFTGTVTGNTFAGARALSVYGTQTISGNAFGSSSIIELNNGAVADLSGNYWGGEAPAEGRIVADKATSDVSFTVDNYYTTYDSGVLGGLVELTKAVTTGAELIDALEAGGEVKLGANIELKPADANIEDDYFIYMLINNDVILDLNGYTLGCAVDQDWDDEYFYACIGGSAQLVITDSVGMGGILARAQHISFESIYIDGEWSDVPSIVVEGGTVNTIALGDGATFGVTGGDVTLTLYDEDYFYEPSEYKAYLEGLVFTTDPTAYLPEGYEVVESENGTYGFAKVASGKVSYRAYVANTDSRNAVQIDLENLYAKDSVVVKLLDADGNVLTVTTLKAGGVEAETYTVNAVLWGNPSGSWDTEIKQTLTVDNAPATIELWLDGKLCDTFENAMGDKMNDYLALGCVYKAVAIGTKYYTTLASAIAAAQAGDTVTLLADIKLADTVTIAKSITVEGNGKKVIPADASKTYSSAFMVGDSGWGDNHGETIAINSVKFEGWTVNFGVVRAQGVTLNMDGCEFSDNSIENAAYAVLSCNYTDALVKNTKFLGNNERAIDVNYNADGSTAVVTVDGCEFVENRTTGAGIIYKNAGNLMVKNSIFDRNTVCTDGNAAIVYAGWGTGAEITGCIFKDNTVVTSHATTKRFASAVFCDGCVVNENAFIGNTATRNGETIATIVAVGAYYGAADISANYWGKAEPEAGVDFTVEYTRQNVAFDSYYASIDEDGTLVDLVAFVAKIGDVKFTSIDDALAAAKDADTVVLLADATIQNEYAVEDMSLTIAGDAKLTFDDKLKVKGESSLNISAPTAGEVLLDEGAILKDSTISGDVFVAGKVLFRGANTVNMIYDYGDLTDYYGTSAPMRWTVEPGASLIVASKARYGLGYGDKVTIKGRLSNALSARSELTEADASLFMHGLVAQESKGWNKDSSFTVYNAYVRVGDNSSFGNKPGNYGGAYQFNFVNAVLDASRLTFYESLSSSEFSFKDSDVKVGAFMTRDSDSVFALRNTKFLSTATSNGTDEGNYHAGKLVLDGSALTYSAEWKVEATGVVEMDATSSITAPVITGTGTIKIDARTVADTEKQVIFADMGGFAGRIEVVGGDYEIVADGVVISKPSAYAFFGGFYYETFKDAFDAAVESDVSKASISVLGDSVVNYEMEIPAGKSISLDLGGKTLAKADGAKIVVDNAIVKFANGALSGFSASDVEIKGDSVATFPSGTIDLADFADSFYKTTNEDGSVSVATKFRSFIQVESGVPCIGFLKNATSEYKVYGKAELTDADWELLEMDSAEDVVSSNPALPLKWFEPVDNTFRFFKVEMVEEN